MWHSNSVFAVNKDGDEKEVKYSDIVRINEALDSDLPKGKLSVAKLQKAYDMIVDKMKEINDIRKEKGNDHMYQGGSEPGKHSVMDHLKSLTAKKKKVQAALDKAVADVGKGQQLDTNVDEASPFVLAADAARDAGKKEFEYPEGSGKMHPVTIKQDIEVEEEINEGTDLYEGDSFSMKRFAGPNGIALQITARKLKGGGYEYIQIDGDKVNEFTRAMVHVGQEFRNLDRQLPVNDGKYKSDAQRKAIYATKAEKGELKEFTDNSFAGAELIDDVSKDAPDMFGKQLFSDLLPMGVASEDDAVKALQAHDKSGIKQRMGQYAPMFVHVQYHEFEHEGEKYRLHQSQYYNNNFAEKDPDFNPKVTKLILLKITKPAVDRRDSEESERIGVILAKTDAYLKDLEKLNISKRAMQEGVNENHIDVKAPGFKHDCAAKVVHETYGVGICIPEKHTLI